MKPSIVQLVTEYLAGPPKRTIQDLADKSDVNEKTIRRILKGESEAPSINSVLKLARVIFFGDEQKVTNFMIECGYEDFQVHKKIREISSAEEKAPTIMKRATESTDWYRLVGFITMEGGFTKEQIVKDLGPWGLSIIEQLESTERLDTLSSGNLRLKNAHLGNLDGSTLKSFVSTAIALFDPLKYGESNCQLGHLHRGVNEEGRWKVKQVLMEAILKMICISNEHPGSIPISVFTGMITLSRTAEEKDI